MADRKTRTGSLRWPHALCTVAWLLACNACSNAYPNVTTQHNDNFRTGAYLAETTLTPDRVQNQGMHIRYWLAPENAFLSSAPPGQPAGFLDGAILTQLLYVRQVPFSNGLANGLFAATMRAKVYALNADDGSQKWAADLMQGDPRPCRAPRALDATPVIDIDHQRLFVVFSTQAGGGENCGPSVFGNFPITYFLASLDITNGNAVFKQVQAHDDRTGAPFTDPFQNAHPALLLDHDSVFIAFGSDAGLEGQGPYQGWVMRYNRADLKLLNAFCTSPTEIGAGIWQGGAGLAADPVGNLYFLTGNGIADFDRHFNGRTFFSNHLYADSFVKLALSGGKLVPSAFAPEDAADQLNLDSTYDPSHPPPFGCGLLCKWDADLGSGGAMIIPDSNRVVGGGKTGVMYVLDQGSMTRVQQFEATTNQYHPWERWQGFDVGPHLHGSPTYWRGPDGRYGYLYVWGEKDFLKRYRFDTRGAKFEEQLVPTTPTTASMQAFPYDQADIKALPSTMPGGMISLSADGNKKGTGIVWATLPDAPCMPSLSPCWSKPRPPFPAAIYAFDAENLKRLLWNNATFSMQDAHWAPPTIADGKVFVPSGAGMIVVYELCQQGMQCIGSPNPIQPIQPACQGCHSVPFQRPSLKFTPLRDRFPNEGAASAFPKMALHTIAPPAGHKQDLILNGDGLQIYQAVGKASERGKLQWQLRESIGELREFWSLDATARPSTEPLRIRISPGSKWSASDGTTALVQIAKTAPAPEKNDAPWMLFRVTRSNGKGLLSSHGFIQCVYTDGGGAPGKSPKRRGEIARVPYRAQYWIYR